jgi:hypothetical protein
MRSSAVLLICGGLLQIPATLVDPDLYDPQSLRNPLEAPDHVLYWVAYLLITAGLPGALLGQLERLARWGAVGFMLALAGSALTVTVSVIAAHVLPATVSILGPSATVTGLVQPGARLATLLMPVALTSLTFFVGYVLFGAATARAGVFPAWCGWLLATGALLTLAAAAGPLGRIPVALGSVLMGAAWLGIGHKLLGRDPLV